jgi:hypothetical protein
VSLFDSENKSHSHFSHQLFETESHKNKETPLLRLQWRFFAFLAFVAISLPVSISRLQTVAKNAKEEHV